MPPVVPPDNNDNEFPSFTIDEVNAFIESIFTVEEPVIAPPTKTQHEAPCTLK